MNTDINVTVADLADRIEAIVRELDGSVSHGTLINRLGALVRGDHSLSNDNANVVLFVGCSEVFAEAIKLLQTQQRVEIEPCSMFVAMVDGIPMPTKMPFVGKRPPKNGYKHPHFCPVVLNLPKKAKKAA